MIVSCDFETTENNDGSMRVWLADACTVDKDLKHYTFESIADMHKWFLNFDDITTYWHNLKFDGSYWLWYFQSLGYKFVEKPKNPKEYFFLITDRLSWFFGSAVLENGTKIKFIDSLKKIPLPVKKMAEAYHLPIMKGEIDYKLYRPIGYKSTPLERKYIHTDTEIVARALLIHLERGMIAMTAPADAMADFKSMVDFDKLFVPKWWYSHKTAESYCRKSYSGGISWVNPEIEGKTVKHGFVYDMNSMYPYVMKAHPFPIGYPTRWYNKIPQGHDLYIARCKIENLNLMAGHPACIRDQSNRSWIENDFSGELTLTSVDIKLIQENYYCDSLEIIDGYSWKGVTGAFDCYLNKWIAIKENSEGALRQLAKLMLNAFYGKFGTNPVKKSKQPSFDSDDKLEWVLHEETDGKTFNVAIASFTTAYARYELVKAINNSTGMCYCDTDSVHVASLDGVCAKFIGKIHDTDVGAWKKESSFVRARFLRQKTYIEEAPNGRLIIAACGCPETSKNYITFDNFEIGASYKGKLMSKMKQGGTDLISKRFTIRAPLQRF